jgi:Ca-activated chloride channel family protein
VTQVYKNEGKKTLEAIYIFPGSTRAAVYAMRMTVGDRVIDAEIMERQKARETYENAKKQGQTASLLEQQRPNVFQMNVANILPGDLIQVEMKYTELLEPEDTVYEFVYPAVVGPRYSNTPAAGAPDTQAWVENPYLHQGEGTPYEFGLKVDLAMGMPIAKLTSPSHSKAAIDYASPSQAAVKVEGDPHAGTKDFVLRYQLAGGKIDAGLMLYPGKDENFFLLMMEPPARVDSKAIVPREYIYIVDVSGSMNGFPLEEVGKPLMKEMISQLRPEDFMNVLLFAGGSDVLSAQKSLTASEANKAKAIQWIDRHQGSGGTEILPALQRAMALPGTEGVSRIVVVITDGYVSVEPEVFDLIRKNLGKASLFSFGIGSSVNRHLIEGMARAGMGEPFVVLNADEGRRQAAQFKKYIESPVLTDIAVKFEGFNAYDVEPAAVPDLFALRPVVLFGKYKGSPSGKIRITGRAAGGAFDQAIDVTEKLASEKNTSLRLLWARHRIRNLADLALVLPESDIQKDVTALGLKYSLMTAYTSFVAVDKLKRSDGTMETVKQPLPLPEGVSDLAVGDDASKGRGYVSAPSGGLMPKLYSAAPPTKMPAGPYTTAVEESKDEPMQQIAGGETGKKEDKPGALTVTVSDVTGGVQAATLEQAIRAKLTTFDGCVAPSALGTGAEVVFEITLDASGRVTNIKQLSASLKDAASVKCLEAALKAISFGPQKGPVTAKVKLTV